MSFPRRPWTYHDNSKGGFSNTSNATSLSPMEVRVTKYIDGTTSGWQRRTLRTSLCDIVERHQTREGTTGANRLAKTHNWCKTRRFGRVTNDSFWDSTRDEMNAMVTHVTVASFPAVVIFWSSLYKTSFKQSRRCTDPRFLLRSGYQSGGSMSSWPRHASSLRCVRCCVQDPLEELSTCKSTV